MDKTLTSVIVLLLALIAVFLLTSYYQRPATSPTAPDTAGTSNVVTIRDLAFNPITLTVDVGTTVTWNNEDSAVHDIQSDTFNSPVLSKGGSFSHTFDQAGTFEYYCNIHPAMTGKIIVK